MCELSDPHYHLRIHPRRKVYTYKDLYKNVHNSFIYNSQISFNLRMNK